MNRSASVNRRTFVLGAGAAALATACGGVQGSAGEAATEGPSIDDGTRFLQAAFPDGFRGPSTFVTGQPGRAPFILSGPDGAVAVNDIPELIEASVTMPGGETVTASMQRRGVGLAVPHYPLLFDAPEAGTYTVRANLADQVQQLEFLVVEPDQVGLVQPGAELRVVDTPTFDDARGVDPICTRFDPCPFHEANVADVIGNGRPTALLIATPGFCQTTSCGPVVDLLMELDPTASMNVVHAEVYTEPDRLDEVPDRSTLLAPIIGVYDMGFEPSLLVAGADGVVTARLDFSFDRDEIAEALDSVI